jgi:hypothetical protein
MDSLEQLNNGNPQQRGACSCVRCFKPDDVAGTAFMELLPCMLQRGARPC